MHQYQLIDLAERLQLVSATNGGESVLLLPSGGPGCPWTMTEQPYGILVSQADVWEHINAVAEITAEGVLWRAEQ